MDFLEEVGTVALGSRLRRLSEGMTADATLIFELYDVGLDPRWFPVFQVLARRGPLTVTQIAQAIGHSHASVSQILSAMRRRRLVLTRRDTGDRRATVVRLSAAGKRLIEPLEAQCDDVRAAVDGLLAEAAHDLWRALADTERLLSERSLLNRVRDVRRARARAGIEIVGYQPRWRADFERLNREWIEQYWELEEADRIVLEDPEGRVLTPGGFILMAVRDDRPVGTCAMLARGDDGYELAKMAVTPAEQGSGTGELLATAAIEQARQRGAGRVYVESNTRLEPAIRLYRKLGFREFAGEPSPYARCDIQMERLLDHD